MSHKLSKRLAALEQAAKAPQTILVLWTTPMLNTLTNGGQRIQREPDEPEETFIRRGRALSEGGIMFGQ
jgi:hypothetical protein